ncbi:MAG: hypothetical protein AVDCRST_MAG11-3339 [uncultured Gemmatimonadaceae bacterium]|uniref:Uncharacterized protein n=1 Tax=uncultured Gemmatimonadaceae bacterium TaxID=246130 RepID=A0A6J4M275_9BACT|nr:MAG: hypothetical protein AVDCRST_MAG11-3339 [uncultured Gemmatimonadaceae bacterium]
MHDDVEVELPPGLHHPEALLDLLVRRDLTGEPVEEGFDLFARDHATHLE